MEFKPSCFRDIDKYYRNTWVKFKEFGEKLFHVRSVDPEVVTGVDEDGNEFVLHLVEEAPYTIDYVLPNRAIFTHRGEVMMLQRVPARQYQRGLSDGNTRIIAVPSGAKRALGVDVLKSFVNKQSFVSLKDALFGKGTQKSVVLSARMSFLRPAQFLYVDCTAVGDFNRETNTMKVDPLFLPEVQELIDQDPFQVKVVCYE